jgi:L-lysine exporter family protein LysE/ArgO
VSFGALGAGYIFSQNIFLQKLIGIAGVTFLLFYGYKSFQSARQQNQETIDIRRQQISLKEVVIATFSISLLNPWALMDTMVIIGGAAAQYESIKMTLIFMMGSFTASALWFSTLGFGSKKLQHVLKTPKVNKAMDLIAAIIMWLAALYLTKTLILA